MNMTGLPRYEEFFRTGVEHLHVHDVPNDNRMCAICRLEYPEVYPLEEGTNLWWLSHLPPLLNDVGRTPALLTVSDLPGESDIPNNDPVRIRQCNHVFGLGCLRSSLTTSTLCSFCRRALYRHDPAADRMDEWRRRTNAYKYTTTRAFLTDHVNWPGQRIIVQAGAIAHSLHSALQSTGRRLRILSAIAPIFNRVRHVLVCAFNLLDGQERTCTKVFTTLWRCVEGVLPHLLEDTRLRRWAKLAIRHLVAEQRIAQEALGTDALEEWPVEEVEMIPEVERVINLSSAHW
ncbi:hypothetical protein W97_05987 [Coniosporium apollinis CBS 100218]|uniref:RING-type domain-containing protein n=1 Tax=Coniosporium apollinis (strain CBS 100218) TaxID=1168221 RepID=R7YYL0_CONA1|nr:uncharacterized protein W97_05987 [Coniosporium apollinis CBS 100218]EON66741.1 hypothetical protein W97_05987 [Coniosporium apollinis CBS 100218]